jgi:uncharacterized RDD family membrane protein YckC
MPETAGAVRPIGVTVPAYATFWQRLAAGVIDVFVLSPLVLVDGRPSSKVGVALVGVPLAFAYAAYSIYMHGHGGQTVGKRLMGIRVVAVNGQPIAWRQAWLRGALDIVLSLSDAVARLMALASIADAKFYGVPPDVRFANLIAAEPSWTKTVMWIGAAWALSEVVVMLFNTKRRGLHDFVAGTVVIRDAPAPTHEPVVA